MDSPFADSLGTDWVSIRDRVLAAHPLTEELIVEAVLTAWKTILLGKFGELTILDLQPQPQIMGFLLHELIPVEIAKRAAGWRRGKAKTERDVHCDDDLAKSIEIKTSSNANNLFANRSFGKRSARSKAVVGAYYIGVNFEKFGGPQTPRIRKIRFGWLDPDDWRAQKEESGQSATFSKEVRDKKLKVIYSLPTASKGRSKGKTRGS
jgi:hypothetical protein